jgi:hypothetical protein
MAQLYQRPPIRWMSARRGRPLAIVSLIKRAS